MRGRAGGKRQGTPKARDPAASSENDSSRKDCVQEYSKIRQVQQALETNGTRTQGNGTAFAKRRLGRDRPGLGRNILGGSAKNQSESLVPFSTRGRKHAYDPPHVERGILCENLCFDCPAVRS